jgi:hypothetical protein
MRLKVFINCMLIGAIAFMVTTSAQTSLLHNKAPGVELVKAVNDVLVSTPDLSFAEAPIAYEVSQAALLPEQKETTVTNPHKKSELYETDVSRQRYGDYNKLLSNGPDRWKDIHRRIRITDSHT